MKTIVRNTTMSPRGICLPLPNAGMEYVTLLPGVNEVPSDVWVRCVPHVRGALEADLLIVEVEDLEEGANPLATLKDRDAIRMVDDTVVEDTLRGWLRKERRPKVVKAIKARIDALQLTPEEIEGSRKAMSKAVE